ncbi:lipoprotein NlpI [Catenovulum agarivorans DS-2]|uniref:Lipoprotein NlpI n=1 Tax=Catenovulum agarivorans DS-2 TaxID=1328313 RepID=W7QA66_9ALTE|nr:lipoprotein NlpI [Catenovulum agarivorans]EWH09689.1 lipoprotein NlpI [Catenovulum agarivorans DS-2]
MHIFFKAALALLLPLQFLGCSATQQPAQVKHIANTYVDSVQHQIAIRRLSDFLHQQDLSEAQKAELFFRRGLLYDEIGLMHLSYFDMLQAIENNPTLVEAYNILGIYYVRQNEFGRAYEAFDSVLELKADHNYAYFNRAIALYYGERPQLALKDFESFYQQDSNDPYRLMWWYFAELAVEQRNPDSQPVALQNLKNRSALLAKNDWGKALIKLYTQELTPEQLLQLAATGNDSEQMLNEKLCEAYFYIAKYYAQLGDKVTAEFYFKAAISTHVYQFVEFRYAQMELARLSNNSTLSADTTEATDI